MKNIIFIFLLFLPFSAFSQDVPESFKNVVEKSNIKETTIFFLKSYNFLDRTEFIQLKPTNKKLYINKSKSFEVFNSQYGESFLVTKMDDIYNVFYSYRLPKVVDSSYDYKYYDEGKLKLSLSPNKYYSFNQKGFTIFTYVKEF